MKKRYIIILLTLMLALSSCNNDDVNPSSIPEISSTQPEIMPEPPIENDANSNDLPQESEMPEDEPTVVSNAEELSEVPNDLSEEMSQITGQEYIYSLVQETLNKIIEPNMSEYDKAKTVFDYMIENTHLVAPVGLDLWRIRGNDTVLPSYLENRSLSVLLYGLGMCEDYASTFTLLLRGAGLEAEYVPGLTYSTQGEWVDHSWTVAKIDGVWYHLDSQLEDNVSRHNTILYRYFMKSDATMIKSHRWGQNLIDSHLLTDEQNEELAQNYMPMPCPEDYAVPSRRSFTKVAMPDVELIKQQIEQEFSEYEETHGSLEHINLNITPPVFGDEGYGPDEQ